MNFGPFQIVHSLYMHSENSQIQNELAYFDTVLKGMELLQDDYLGGSGQIAFEGVTMTFKSRRCYEDATEKPIVIAANTDITTLREADYTAQINNVINGN